MLLDKNCSLRDVCIYIIEPMFVTQLPKATQEQIAQANPYVKKFDLY